MAYCKFCGEQDESRLILSSRVVNGMVEQEWVCSDCIWRDEFVHEAEGEDGKLLSEECERADNKSVPARGINPLGLQE